MLLSEMDQPKPDESSPESPPLPYDIVTSPSTQNEDVMKFGRREAILLLYSTVQEQPLEGQCFGE